MEGLLAGIRAAPARAGSTRVIALDGRSGAGKSTLAQALAGRLNAPLVSLEHLYGGWDGLDEGIARLRSAVLLPLAGGRAALPLAGGRAASVPRYDWHTLAWGEPWTLAPPELLIVEGVGAGSLSAAPYTSMLVWLEA
ncbi:MAG: phosphoribulokinase, partial [Solirubrobacteraceae bacterium]